MTHIPSRGRYVRGCRCDGCCAKNTAYHYEYRKARPPRAYGGPLPPGDPRHGTLNGYHYYRCRCDACAAESRKYRQQYVASRRPWGVEPRPPTGMALVPCWCEAEVREIPVTDVIAGNTWSCGPECVPGRAKAPTTRR